MKWKKGRQGTGYDVLTLLSTKLPKWLGLKGIDCHILRYNKSDYIPPHTDKVEDGEHWRMNIILKKPLSGGEFICKEAKSFLNRVYIFRPDVMEHSVTACESERIVFSLGIVL